MKLEYRIASFNTRHHYPQVRIKYFLFWGNWKRIAEHVNGSHGLYDGYNYHKTLEEAKSIIQAFDIFFKRRGFKPSFINYKPNSQ